MSEPKIKSRATGKRGNSIFWVLAVISSFIVQGVGSILLGREGTTRTGYHRFLRTKVQNTKDDVFLLRTLHEKPGSLRSGKTPQWSPESRVLIDAGMDFCTAIEKGEVPGAGTLPYDTSYYTLDMELAINNEGKNDDIAELLQASLQGSAAPHLAGCGSEGEERTAGGESLFAIFSLPQKKPSSEACFQSEDVTVTVSICLVTYTSTISVHEANGARRADNVGLLLEDSIQDTQEEGVLEVPNVEYLESVTVSARYEGEDSTNNVADESSSGKSFSGTVLVVTLVAAAVVLVLTGMLWVQKQKFVRRRTFYGSLHSNGGGTGSTPSEIEVRTWYSIREQFSPSQQDLFQVPVTTRLQQDPDQIEAWLEQVRVARGTAGDNTDSPDTNGTGEGYDSLAKQIEVFTWFSLQDQFLPKNQSLFGLPPDDRIQQSQEDIEDWLQKVNSAWDENQREKGELQSKEAARNCIEATKVAACQQCKHSTSCHYELSKQDEIEVRTWFAMQEEFQPFENSLFQMPVEEILQENPEDVRQWLMIVQVAWGDYQSANSELTEDNTDGQKHSMKAQEVKVRTWYSLQEEFNVFDESLFKVLADERLQQPPEHIQDWLDQVQSAWEDYEKPPLAPSQDGHNKEEPRSDEKVETVKQVKRKDEKEYGSMVEAIEVRMWFSLQEEFNAFDEELFQMSAEDRLQQHPDEIEDWLQKVQASWDRYNNRLRGIPEEEPVDDQEDEDTDFGTVAEDIEVRTWFSVQEEFEALDEELFKTPAEDRLSQHPKQIRAWLNEVQYAWDKYQKKHNDDVCSKATSSTATSSTASLTLVPA